MLTVVLMTLILASSVVFWWRGRRARLCFAKLPSLPQLPLLGNAHQLFGGCRMLFLRLVQITAEIEQKKLPLVWWMGPCPAIILSDLDDIKAVTNTFLEKPHYYKFFHVWLGDGLFTAPAAIWKRNIKKLAGTFSRGIVDGFQDVFDDQAQKLVLKLKSEAGKPPFDVMEHLAQTTLEAICQTALGVPKITDSIVTGKYYAAFNRMLELYVSRAFNLILHFDFIYQLTSSRRELMKCVRVLHNVSDTVMRKRNQEYEAKRVKNSESDHSPNGNFKTFLDVLLELNARDPSFTREQLKNEVDTVILAGQETVAITLYYTLLMLGCKPDVQDKLHAEMMEIFGESKRKVTKEDLARMSYCEAVLSESQRLYPPAPGVMRYADHDLQIKSCTIPKGTICIINIWGAGRSQQQWGSDASEFRPERWLSPSSPPASLMAFSTGKRACIGRKYAIAFLKTMIAHLVREFQFTSEADKLDFRVDLALKPICGHLLQVQLRENS